MPRHKEAKKDAANGETRRRAVSRQRPVDIRMGEPSAERSVLSCTEYIGTWGKTQGTETSKYLQEKKVRNDSVSSGERKRRSPNHHSDGVIGLTEKVIQHDRRIAREGKAKRVTLPYPKLWRKPSKHLSTSGHVESWRNYRGPSRKAKYSFVTDREPVPWGKGEKNPGRGVKENLKPYAYKKSEPVKGWWRAFCRMSRRVMMWSEVK